MPTLTATSSDGKLAGRYLNDRKGVLLRAQFLQSTIHNWTFESTTDGWVVGTGGGTVTRTTTSPLAGTGSLLNTWTTGGSSQSVKRVLTGGEIITGGKRLRVAFMIRTTSTQTSYLGLRVELKDTAGKLIAQNLLPSPVLDTTRTWFTDFYVPAGRSVGQVEIWLDTVQATKVARFDNIQIIQRPPEKVRFWRKGTKDKVRGGDPAQAVGGVAYAYDDELTPGAHTEWYAEPLYGVKPDVGPATTSVAFTIEDRAATEPSHFVKSLETPGLFGYLATNTKEISQSRAVNLANKQNTGKPSGGISSAYAISGNYQLITQSIIEKKNLEKILEEAVIFIQPFGRYNRRPFYALCSSFTVHDVGKMSDEYKRFDITFTEVERPDTLSQPTFLPLRDYAWLGSSRTAISSASGNWASVGVLIRSFDGEDPVIKEQQDAHSQSAALSMTLTNAAVGDTVFLIHIDELGVVGDLQTPTGTAVASWTLHHTLDGGSGDHHAKVWSGVVTTANGTVNPNTSPNTDERFASLLVLGGTQTFDTAASQAPDTNGTLLEIPPLTPTGKNDLLFAAWACDGTVTLTVPETMTAYDQFQGPTGHTFISATEQLTTDVPTLDYANYNDAALIALTYDQLSFSAVT